MNTVLYKDGTIKKDVPGVESETDAIRLIERDWRVTEVIVVTDRCEYRVIADERVDE